MNFLISRGYSKSTAELPRCEQLGYWRDIICDEFVKLDCEAESRREFHGELRGGVSLSTLRFSEVFSDAQLVQRSRRQIAKSTEADFLISFQLEQRGIVRQNGREAVLEPGSFALYDSTQPYTLCFRERFHQLVVQMPKAVLSRHLIDPEQYTAVAICGKSGVAAILNQFIVSLVKELHHLDQTPEELSDNLVNLIAMAFSSSVMLEQVGSQPVVSGALKRRIYHYIETNLCNPELSNRHVASAQGISERYLNKLFQGEAETVRSLILHKRLEKAHSLLTDPAYRGHNIEAIAYSVGFSSAGHFSRSFKSHFGISPSDLRCPH